MVIIAMIIFLLLGGVMTTVVQSFTATKADPAATVVSSFADPRQQHSSSCPSIRTMSMLIPRASPRLSSLILRHAKKKKPQRLSDNVDGVVYVNDKCINCAACSGFAPQVFRRNNQINKHVVYYQPTDEDEDMIASTKAALAACPVAAIRLETLAEKRHGMKSNEDKQRIEDTWSEQDEWLVKSMTSKEHKIFPRPFLQDELNQATPVNDVYWVGHHNEASFGAIPYLVRVAPPKNSSLSKQENDDDDDIWILVDTPKYSVRAVRDVVSVTGPSGPDYLFLSHVDDTADHGLWSNEFSTKQIFHSGDLGIHNWLGDKTLEDVDILLPNVDKKKSNDNEGLTAYDLDGTILDDDWLEDMKRENDNSKDTKVVILHAPGHSPGSICLWVRFPPQDSDDDSGTSSAVSVLFTGDTYAYTQAGGGRMTGFGRYGNDRNVQVETLSQLGDILLLSDDNDDIVIAPGHGHARDYRGVDATVRAMELQQAQEDLLAYVS